ncbi:MAG: nucleotidyltransferase domain-containing protein [Chlorobium limicola]|uniref:nucleotidyltransferase domain-containing protein n=1 Tax=Chlorobium limicola TaxID=1092 RepID=UPI0023F2E510|nr:nucleotidyltransferase domain-containing protein [Chlorobium limicola]NTV21398.1 nucleotidyltransferase domain-containing protein [Chlorobium limicola]
MKYGLDDTTIARIHGVIASYGQIDKAILYGSRAKGNYRAGSDIDLTFVGNHDLNLTVLYRIMDDIDDLLLPYTFDISLLHSISDRDVLDHIKNFGKVFYEKTQTSQFV